MAEVAVQEVQAQMEFLIQIQEQVVQEYT